MGPRVAPCVVMKWILAVAGMIATTTGCTELLCDGDVKTTRSWQGHEPPRAMQIATSPVTTAVVWAARLSLVSDDRLIATSPLQIAAPRAIAMAPDGTGIVVDGALRVQTFDALGVPGEPLDLDELASDAPAAVFDGSAFSIVWSVGQQVFLARVSTTGALVQGRTLVGVGAPDCPSAGPVAVAGLDDHSAWVAWTAGSATHPAILVARLVDGRLGAPRELSAASLPGRCGGQALKGIAGSGADALVLVGRQVLPLRTDGTGSPPVDIGADPVTLIGAPDGFALVKRYETDAFPRDLYTPMRMLDRDGVEYLENHVRGAAGVYANAFGRFVAATGVDETVEDAGTSTLGVTRFYEDGQGTPVVLATEKLQHTETTSCESDPGVSPNPHPQGGTY